jgi:hypothetical protein
MENFYENFLQEIENADMKSVASGSSVERNNVTELQAPKKDLRASRTEIWQAILAGSEKIPESLRHAFVVQVLVSILDDQQISIQGLDNALRRAFEAVQRVEEASQYRRSA